MDHRKGKEQPAPHQKRSARVRHRFDVKPDQEDGQPQAQPKIQKDPGVGGLGADEGPCRSPQHETDPCQVKQAEAGALGLLWNRPLGKVLAQRESHHFPLRTKPMPWLGFVGGTNPPFNSHSSRMA